ncbi:NADP-dependent oxidoreductase [Lentilactobacillus hilgardii]|uniref:Zinc-binding dehydrogenase n=1 Tax=Lentilactobacillus hilgardii TaxID=1588 RepID=A0A6P1E6L4_LENHI|nr:GroES-like protein [Lentilactobacillus hilgardii ATCC 27305]MCT3392612.1 NADP-dependent oxidoreductase [Lentilactobacillus hilgardii]QHB53026.1 zinc-binding dehydrogenase [Lentilactobacillus hilgardii]RRG08593.1 MAG: NADP-dependent oxidoreductase [Lactobacillus sp.]
MRGEKMTNTEKMDAIVINAYGDENQLTEQQIDIPSIKNNDLLVKVQSIGVNPIDWKTRMGLRQSRYPFDFPIVLGQEMAGTVVKVGKEVSGFKVNDEVIGYGTPSNRGTYAQYYAINADQTAHKPENLSFEEAAGLGLAGTTAWEAIFDAGQLKADQTVLILAGSGGVGLMAIQLAKNAGAHVVTTTSSKNADYVKSLGADEVIDYNKDDFSTRLSNIDLVFDTLGGDNQKAAFKVVRPGGRLISIVETTDQAKALGNQYGVYFDKINAHPDKKIMAKLADMFGSGKLVVRVAENLPFTVENVRKMHLESESGHVVGKLVLNIN